MYDPIILQDIFLMNCCYKNQEPLQIQINQLPSRNLLPKFSFKSFTTASAFHDSNASQISSAYSSRLNKQISQLQQEYKLLKEEQTTVSQLQINTLTPLEEQIRFYERQIIIRSEEIDDLTYLFRRRLDQKKRQAERIRQGAPISYSQNQQIYNRGNQHDKRLFGLYVQ